MNLSLDRENHLLLGACRIVNTVWEMLKDEKALHPPWRSYRLTVICVALAIRVPAAKNKELGPWAMCAGGFFSKEDLPLPLPCLTADSARMSVCLEFAIMFQIWCSSKLWADKS